MPRGNLRDRNGASNYTYVEACEGSNKRDLMSH